MAQHQCTLPTASIARLMSARGGVCVPTRQRRWLFHDSSQHDRGSRFPGRPCPRVEQFIPSFVTSSSSLSTFKRHLKTYLFARPRTEGAADLLVSFSVYRTCRLFCVLRVLAVFWTKRHANLSLIIIIINNNWMGDCSRSVYITSHRSTLHSTLCGMVK